MEPITKVVTPTLTYDTANLFIGLMNATQQADARLWAMGANAGVLVNGESLLTVQGCKDVLAELVDKAVAALAMPSDQIGLVFAYRNTYHQTMSLTSEGLTDAEYCQRKAQGRRRLAALANELAAHPDTPEAYREDYKEEARHYALEAIRWSSEPLTTTLEP